jgi:hypothetical protein
MLPVLSRDLSSRELLHKAKLFRLLFDNDVIDRPHWTQVRVKNTDARARFDRDPYRSAKLIIDEPGPGQIKPLWIRTVRANDQRSSGLVTGCATSLGCYDRCCYSYSLHASYCSRCSIIPRALRSSLRKRQRCNEHEARATIACFTIMPPSF